MGRLGRPRKSMVQRYPSGDCKPSADVVAERKRQKGEVIEPTPETAARRLAAFGNAKAEKELCCPVDLLSSHLTDEQYHAGRYARTVYARYCIAIGSPRVVAGQLRDFVQGGGGSPMDADQAKQAVKDYVEATTAIRRYSYRSLKDVERIMHGSMPRSMDALCGGLTALADYMGLSRREAA